ncbi:MAG: molybdopterin-dependent oxidoreductase [Hyphomicrobiaceae bacterium]
MTISLIVNDTALSVESDPTERLSDVLREGLGLKGTKIGCNAGDCGACTVLLDGLAVCSCLVAVGQVESRSITTIEAEGANTVLAKLKRSFLLNGAAQCGICTPGMLMSAAALLAREPYPSRAQIRDALGGVLCRCTGYQKIVEAVKFASSVPATEQNSLNTKVSGKPSVGSRIPHIDGKEKVIGKLRFGSDGIPPNALWVRVIRSPFHHANFSFGDLDQFVADHPGVLAILTASDIPGTNRFGVIPQFADQPVFAEKRIRYRGEAVAAVVGEYGDIRRLKDDEIPIEWEQLEELLSPTEALRPSAPQLHEVRCNNILVEGLVERGDASAALAGAAFRVKVRTSTPAIEHAYIEPEAGYAEIVDGQLCVHACTQAPQMDREELQAILSLKAEKVRIVPTGCGGGFGSKLDISLQPYIALAALKFRRPAALVYTRSESMQSTTKRHPSEIEIEVGCDASGKISGLKFDATFNTGAYASWGPTVANRVPVHASGPYFVADYRARSRAVHTNAPPSGAFRGFGVPQLAVAQELAMDKLAMAVGEDRLLFRLRNALDNGMPTVTGQVFEEGVGIMACLEALKGPWTAALDRTAQFASAGQPGCLRRGVGIAGCWYGCGNTSLPNPSTMRIGITRAGHIVLHQGATDIGQGSNTVMAQIAADALGVPIGDIKFVGSDTACTPDAGKTSASRQTFVSGQAVLRAATELRRQLLRHGNVGAAATVSFGNGEVDLTDFSGSARIDLSAMEENAFGYVFMSEETYNPPTTPLDAKGQGAPYASYGYGAQMVELTVDVDLGTVRLEYVAAAHDVGRAINPMLVEGQIEGGVAQGIGLALMEDYQAGRTENLHDYLIPTIGDIPHIESIIVEVEDGVGPLGAKGLGEHVLIPTAAAIVNAIRHATGVEICDLPATPHKVLRALGRLKQTGGGNELQ